jgi:hypothetical protein
MKNLIIPILLLSVFSLNAQAAQNIQTELNISIKNKCVLKVKTPKKPLAFNKYFKKEDYNEKVDIYNKNINIYKKCISGFITELNREIDNIEMLGRKTVEKAQGLKVVTPVE